MEEKLKVEKGVQYIRVKNKLGMQVTFSSLGATIVSILIDNVPMTQSPLDIKDLVRTDIYNGKTIGQIANRVKGGIVEINGKTYQLDKNEGENSLHGGAAGFSNQLFGIQRYELDGKFIVIYSLQKRKNKGFLPGKTEFFVGYSMSDDNNELRIDFRASSTEDTIVSLTNHSFFCLGESDINHLSLQIPASRFIETDPKTLIPLREREILPCLDFRKKKPIVKNINDHYLVSSRTAGYDHDFIFDGENHGPVILESPKYRLEIDTDFSGIQIYTDNYDNGARMINSLNKLRRGVALEPEDSILNREILKKGEAYERYIVYKFTTK